MAQQHETSSMLSINEEMATHKAEFLKITTWSMKMIKTPPKCNDQVLSNSDVKFSTDMPNTTSTQDLYKIISYHKSKLQTWKQENHAFPMRFIKQGMTFENQVLPSYFQRFSLI